MQRVQLAESERENRDTEGQGLEMGQGRQVTKEAEHGVGWSAATLPLIWGLRTWSGSNVHSGSRKERGRHGAKR